MSSVPRPDDQLYTIDHNGCWNFIGSKFHNGYGHLNRNDKDIRATHYFYRKYKGYFDSRLELDHLCSNVACVNPEHLEPVTHTENMRRSRATKLNFDLVGKIKSLHQEGISQTSIAKTFKIDQSTVSKVVNQHIWKN